MLKQFTVNNHLQHAFASNASLTSLSSDLLQLFLPCISLTNPMM